MNYWTDSRRLMAIRMICRRPCPDTDAIALFAGADPSRIEKGGDRLAHHAGFSGMRQMKFHLGGP